MHRYSPQQPVERKLPSLLASLILIVLLVGGVYGCASASSNSAAQTSGPTKTVTPTPAANPRIGKTYGDFIAKYGQPVIGDGGYPRFYANSSKSISISPYGLDNNGRVDGLLSAPSNVVYYVSVFGPRTWAYQNTFNYCQQFLPVGAVIYQPTNVIKADNVTLYQSSVGTIVLQMNGNNKCDVYLNTGASP